MSRAAHGWVLTCLLLLCPMVAASAESPPELPGSRQVGAGELTWFGMTVYQARLFAEDGRYVPQRPHALKLEYRFSFSARQLAERSVEEIERIHGRQADRNALAARLQAVFRDVEEGVYILGVHYPGRGAEFYSAGELLGRLQQPRLAAMFFDIWLDAGTSEPELREQLLGGRS